jgi:hypothetical protein
MRNELRMENAELRMNVSAYADKSVLDKETSIMHYALNRHSQLY